MFPVPLPFPLFLAAAVLAVLVLPPLIQYAADRFMLWFEEHPLPDIEILPRFSLDAPREARADLKEIKLILRSTDPNPKTAVGTKSKLPVHLASTAKHAENVAYFVAAQMQACNTAHQMAAAMLRGRGGDITGLHYNPVCTQMRRRTQNGLRAALVKIEEGAFIHPEVVQRQMGFSFILDELCGDNCELLQHDLHGMPERCQPVQLMSRMHDGAGKQNA